MCKHPNKAFIKPGEFSKSGKKALLVCSYDTTFIYKKPNGYWAKSKEPITQKISLDSRFGKEFIEIPCGKCIECRLNKAKDWASRCMCEAEYYDSNYFVTFTYDDEHVPRVTTPEGEFMTLVKRDLTLFFKRLRKHGYKFRYFACGEYGSKTHRPHYHVCFFGLELDDLVHYKDSDTGEYFNSPKLEKIWGNGFVVVAPLTYETVGYTARYTQKKVGSTPREDVELMEKFGLEPEYVVMSLKPGLGDRYYREHKYEIYEDDKIYLENSRGSFSAKPPKFFDSLLEKENPDLLAEIKAKRTLAHEVAKENKDSESSLPYLERLRIEEKQLLAKTKRLPRSAV